MTGAPWGSVPMRRVLGLPREGPAQGWKDQSSPSTAGPGGRRAAAGVVRVSLHGTGRPRLRAPGSLGGPRTGRVLLQTLDPTQAMATTK